MRDGGDRSSMKGRIEITFGPIRGLCYPRSCVAMATVLPSPALSHRTLAVISASGGLLFVCERIRD